MFMDEFYTTERNNIKNKRRAKSQKEKKNFSNEFSMKTFLFYIFTHDCYTKRRKIRFSFELCKCWMEFSYPTAILKVIFNNFIFYRITFLLKLIFLFYYYPFYCLVGTNQFESCELILIRNFHVILMFF